VRSLHVVAPAPGQPLAAAWREGIAASTGDAVLLCAGAFTPDAADQRVLIAAAERADAVVGSAQGAPVCVLLRRGDVARLALLRNRESGYTAMRELLVRARQRRFVVAHATLSSPAQAVGEYMGERLGFAARRLVERLGWFGFVTGRFSRSHRNVEVWEYRRSSPDENASSRCALCGAGADAQRRLRLQTSDDLRALGEYTAVLCTACAAARTDPPPREMERVISPDVGETAMSGWQRALLRRFIGERVSRVRPLLPRDRRPRVADVGGGACAFANALAATGCDVTVFEPNPANARFANTASGVRFVAAPFDDAPVAAAAIADGSLDAVTMWHSLEHVPDPVTTLALARRLLRPGGVLYVNVPNLDALQADIGGTRWCYADIPHHVTHFTPEGLNAAMRRAGLTGVMPHAWNAEYEVFGFYQTLLNRLTGSHNFFYNRAKKGTHAAAGPFPAWTRLVTLLGPLLLPVALLASWWAAAASKPACAELHAVAPQ
jgi:SAM-dependent methyltransferase